MGWRRRRRGRGRRGECGRRRRRQRQRGVGVGGLGERAQATQLAAKEGGGEGMEGKGDARAAEEGKVAKH